MFYIIPNASIAAEIEANSAEDAMVNFATNMDMDMNAYFRAVTPEEYAKITLETRYANYESHIKDFMKGELMDPNKFGVEDEATASDLAAEAYDLYSQGDGQTEYECIEEVYAEYARSLQEAG